MKYSGVKPAARALGRRKRTQRLVISGFAVLHVAGTLIVGTPAQAAVGDRQWAECVWRTAPVSARNWLGMPAPAWSDNMAAPAETLGHRLIAVCSTAAANELRPNRNPAWGRLMASLRRAQPADVPATETEAPAVLLCRHHVAAGGRDLLYRIDIKRVTAAGEITVFQQYFTDHQGRAVRLPQDLRTLPPAEAVTSAVCRAIGPTGELVDA